MEQAELLGKVKSAVKKLIVDDAHLLTYSVSERSICHQLAIYLAAEFAGYSVDCEYNRHEDVSKRLSFKLDDSQTPRDPDDHGVCVSPDIIIHERGTDARNLLVIELKKDSNPLRKGDYDLKKIRAYVDEIGYDFGLFIELGTGENIGMKDAELATKESDKLVNVLSILS